ncbi:hypothetical protein [Gemmatimonas sp.]|uniref:hypothetical protein n=1 Tax=Gemmatimonas sp. TaxID=1962908 RepID=UPI00398357A1
MSEFIDTHTGDHHPSIGRTPLSFSYGIAVVNPYREVGFNERRLPRLVPQHVMQRRKLTRRLVAVTHTDP